ncbi:MAG: 1-acyl-sn-glycerol-3-phosphate acyltransferase [Granulosicoccus sp.]|nr:1-acyl-sn-glycerol-3-phosphate acyltransferase [Granulosicoccus sp.]
MKDFIVVIRSSLAGSLGLAATLFNSVFVILATPFGDKVQYRFVRGWAHTCHFALRFITGISYEVIGNEKLPQEASIVYMKHQSVWEIIILFRIVPQLVFVLKREAMAIPIFGSALKSLKMIDIDRSSGSTAVAEVIQKGTDRLKQGLWLGIFPEGTRMTFGKTRRFGKSGIYLAQEAKAPLVLIAHNGGEFWPSKSLKIRSGHVKIVISDPVQTQGRTVDEIAAECEAWMEKTMFEISSAYAQEARRFAENQSLST